MISSWHKREHTMKRIIITVILTLTLTAFAIQAVDQTAFSGAGVIESTAGGFKFPDGSVQQTAVTPGCTAITYVPYVILDEGVYCFTGNLVMNEASGTAISINADNVVIDLNGWVLEGLAAGTATLAKGIYGNLRKNVTIRNGTIRGFSVGILLEDSTPPHIISKGHIIENIRADQNTLEGIWVDGTGHIIRNNQVVDTGNGTAEGINRSAQGIRARGQEAIILDNEVINVTCTNSSHCYGLRLDSSGAVVEGNRIHGIVSEGPSYGILVVNADDVMIVNNRLYDSQYGIFFSPEEGGSSGKFRDNLTTSVTTPFTGGNDAGGND
jgi:hypothetical protein